MVLKTHQIFSGASLQFSTTRNASDTFGRVLRNNTGLSAAQLGKGQWYLELPKRSSNAEVDTKICYIFQSVVRDQSTGIENHASSFFPLKTK